MTILTEEFLQGARAGAQHWPVGELKSARQSRGYSIRFKVGVNEEHVVVVDYDRRQVYRK